MSGELQAQHGPNPLSHGNQAVPRQHNQEAAIPQVVPVVMPQPVLSPADMVAQATALLQGAFASAATAGFEA